MLIYDQSIVFDMTFFSTTNVFCFLNSVQTHLFWCSLEAAASNEIVPMSTHNIVFVLYNLKSRSYESFLI